MNSSLYIFLVIFNKHSYWIGALYAYHEPLQNVGLLYPRNTSRLWLLVIVLLMSWVGTASASLWAVLSETCTIHRPWIYSSHIKIRKIPHHLICSLGEEETESDPNDIDVFKSFSSQLSWKQIRHKNRHRMQNKKYSAEWKGKPDKERQRVKCIKYS